eukprot:TRINITY_DN65395_c0_g1_i1.p1 TRINITY_DN65395_c0_g1~~TRINITY_DN65395_c0_g1_i1.p1  ORF type:complete len:722 (+),score=279.68 TRINITY_DN65395_c0_g1_i1:87-2252(+)
MMLRFLFIACLASAAVAANPKESNAVAKVVEMMEDLRAKVEAEGVAEKKSYETYAGWCSDTEAEKDGEITNGKETAAELKATIETGEAEKQKQTDAISGDGGFVQTIAELQKTIADDIATRKEEKKEYDAANKDTEKAIDGLAKAIKAMKASESISLLQEETRHQLRTAAVLADAMGFKGKETLKAIAGPGEADYDFHSGGIIATLEGLHVDFKDADKSADETEAKAVQSFTNSQIALNNDLEKTKQNLETAKEAKGAATAQVGQAKKDLDETETELAADEKYKAELVAMCNEKKATYDQRVATRTEELAALDEATQIIKDSTGKSGGDALLFEVAKKAVKIPAVLMSAEADAEAADRAEAAQSFLQTVKTVKAQHIMKTVRFLRGHGIDKRQQAVELLMKMAQDTHKGRFVAFAQKAAKFSASADVFAEIKKMIADQIDKLKDTAAQSQDKKLSCDKRISESTIKRDNAAKATKRLNTQMTASEARRDELAEDIKRLNDEMDHIAEQVKNATDARNAESTENAADIEEAKIALSGIDAAMKVIRDFYGKNSENSVFSLAQTGSKSHGPAKDAPDAGFKNLEANKGSQAASTGIIGMLEVIQSDFQRSIKDITAAEDSAAKEHTKFVGEADISTSDKKTALDAKNKFHAETVEQLDEETSQINTQLGTLRSAVEELAVLDEECGSQISYEERKAAREEEIEALQEAVERINLFIATQIPAR